jgi:hypothetical protein
MIDTWTRIEGSLGMATCHDCGVDFWVGYPDAKPEPCDYCYEVADLYKVVTSRGTVLHRYHGDDGFDRAWAKADELRAAGKRVKLVTVEGATITRCERHPYEG